AATQHVVGDQECLSAICIGADDDMEARRKEIIEMAKACDKGDGVIILTDMFGGTPSNLAISVMSKGKIEVIAGVNLPMLIKLAEVRHKLSLADAAVAAQDAGRKYISVASALLQKT
ncbi:MAG: PTS fructose transporter subunit IIA, partial [Pseudomonadota bacterium]